MQITPQNTHLAQKTVMFQAQIIKTYRNVLTMSPENSPTEWAWILRTYLEGIVARLSASSQPISLPASQPAPCQPISKPANSQPTCSPAPSLPAHSHPGSSQPANQQPDSQLVSQPTSSQPVSRPAASAAMRPDGQTQSHKTFRETRIEE